MSDETTSLIAPAKCLEIAAKYIPGIASEEHDKGEHGIWTDVAQVAGQIPLTLAGAEDPEGVAGKVNGGDDEASRELVRMAMKDAHNRLAVVRP